MGQNQAKHIRLSSASPEPDLSNLGASGAVYFGPLNPVEREDVAILNDVEIHRRRKAMRIRDKERKKQQRDEKEQSKYRQREYRAKQVELNRKSGYKWVGYVSSFSEAML